MGKEQIVYRRSHQFEILFTNRYFTSGNDAIDYGLSLLLFSRTGGYEPEASATRGHVRVDN